MKNGIIILLILSLVSFQHVDGQKKAKKIIVSGFVTDLNNNPVAGAFILADNSKTNVVTDDKGFFKVKIKPAVKTIGAVDFRKGSGKVELNGKNSVSIVLDGTPVMVESQPDNSEEDDMVNIGYGSVRKKDLTSSTGKINAKGNRYDSYSSIYDMINGELPGVQVMGNSIIVRGIGTNSASYDALLIVDGVAVTSIDNISPREVKSISVLKGSEASIYGARGANGVILITLKKAGDN